MWSHSMVLLPGCSKGHFIHHMQTEEAATGMQPVVASGSRVEQISSLVAKVNGHGQGRHHRIIISGDLK
jgi:hypothetical protein